MEGIEHRKATLGEPGINGVVERTNRALLKECFGPTGGASGYTNTSEIQRDLDTSVEKYNLERSHQGYWLSGRTPAQALCEALGVSDLPPIVGVGA